MNADLTDETERGGSEFLLRVFFSVASCEFVVPVSYTCLKPLAHTKGHEEALKNPFDQSDQKKLVDS